jgi:hypothetical protein
MQWGLRLIASDSSRSAIADFMGYGLSKLTAAATSSSSAELHHCMGKLSTVFVLFVSLW